MLFSRSVLLLAGILTANRMMEATVIRADLVQPAAPQRGLTPPPPAPATTPAPRVEAPTPPRLPAHAPLLTAAEPELLTDSPEEADLHVPMDCEQLETARGLWGALPMEESAPQIAALARGVDKECGFEILAVMDTPVARGFGDDRQWLSYLVEWKLPQQVEGPFALDVSLQVEEEALLGLDPDERQRLLRHRATLVPELLRELESTGSVTAAFLLAVYQEDAAVPLLGRHFIERSDFYGFETSTPDPLAPGQYPAHHAYEESLLRLTGKPVAETVLLTSAERAALMARDDESALYVLSRLAPVEARQIAGRRFRAGEDQVSLSFALVDHLLTPGLSLDEVKEVLGEPQESHGNAWIYPAGERLGPIGLLVIFDRGTLASAELVETGPLLSDR